jgi:Domain of unknown function (DUF1918)
MSDDRSMNSLRESAHPGDWIEVSSTSGAPPRRGQIVRILGPADRRHYEVRWDEQHTSLFYPAEHTTVIRSATRGR